MLLWENEFLGVGRGVRLRKLWYIISERVCGVVWCGTPSSCVEGMGGKGGRGVNHG